MNITEPPRLSRGSWTAGSGRGCAMNIVSWVRGEEVISDMPKNVDPRLATLVQGVNDFLGVREEDELIPVKHTIPLLNIAFDTMGTAIPIIIGTSAGTEEMHGYGILSAAQRFEWMKAVNDKVARKYGCRLVPNSGDPVESHFHFQKRYWYWFKPLEDRLLSSLAVAVYTYREMAGLDPTYTPPLADVEKAIKEMAVVK